MDQWLSRPAIRQRYEQVADRLVADLRNGVLRPGAKLPAERELARQMGVSRATVREALGSLQVHGLVETRHGAGSFVAAEALDRLRAAPAPAGLELPPADAGPASVLAARVVVEPAIAGLAAAHGGRDREVDRLLEVMEQSDDPADPDQRRAWSDADRFFHLRLAVATGNPVLLAFAEHLALLMDQPLWQRMRDESIAVPGRTALHIAEHRLIAAAVRENDPEAATCLAAQHITRVRRYMALD